MSKTIPSIKSTGLGSERSSSSRGVYEFLNTLLRRHRPHDVKRIRLSRHGAQRGTVLDPLGLVGRLVVRDAAQGPSVPSGTYGSLVQSLL